MSWSPVQFTLSKRLNQTGLGKSLAAQQVLTKTKELLPFANQPISLRNQTLSIAINQRDLLAARLQKHELLQKISDWCTERELPMVTKIRFEVQDLDAK